MSSENLAKKIETKDWVYLFIISLFLQFIIYYFSFIYGGSVKALGYISFAGTLISIILAVIAIGYTYGESIKQKTSSDQLLVEIAGLRDIKDKLAGQVGVLENIAAIKSTVENTESAVRNLDIPNQLQKILNIQSMGSFKTNPPDIENYQIKEILMSFEYISDLYIFQILNKISNEGVNDVQELIPALIKDHAGEPSSWLDIANLYTAIYFMCTSLGIIVDSKIPSEVIEIYMNKYPEGRSVSKNKQDLDLLVDGVLYR